MTTDDPDDDDNAFKRLVRRVETELPLRSRFVIILLVASLPGMVVAVMLAVNALDNQRLQIETNAKQLADIQAAQHTNVIENARTMLDTFVEMATIQNLDGTDCEHFLSGWVDRYPSFTSLTLIDEQDAVSCASAQSELPAHFPGERFLDGLRNARDFVVGEYTVSESGVPLIVAARPIIDSGENYVGAIAVGIDLRWLEYLAGRMNLPSGSTITAINETGQVLSHYRAEGVGDDSGELEAPAESIPEQSLREQMAAGGSGVLRGPTQGGSTRVYGFQRTDTGNLGIVVGMPQYMQFEKYGAALRDTLLAPMGILLLALLAAVYASEALVIRWVRKLTGAANRMAGGDLEARSEVPHSRYELGRLGLAFDTMAASIQQKQQEIHARAEQYRELFRELNHRVNNNMQMIRSLIRIRTRRVTDPEARAVILDIEERLAALTEIQRLLYTPDNTRIDMADYTSRLARYLQSVYSSEMIAVEIDAESVALPRTSAIPLGLAMNELIANACKHAFPDRKGTVRVRLYRDGKRFHLIVSDDGIPMPGKIESSGQGRTLGLQVIRSMTGHLDGELTITQDDGGKSFHISFPVKETEGGPSPD